MQQILTADPAMKKPCKFMYKINIQMNFIKYSPNGGTPYNITDNYCMNLCKT